jgi:signal transduction histidine kinase
VRALVIRGFVVVPIVLAAAAAVLVIVDRATVQANSGQLLSVTVAQNVAAPLAAVLGLTILGALIGARVPSNRIGRLFRWVGVALAVTLFLQEYAVRGLVSAPGSLPLATQAAWLQFWLSRLLLPLALVVFFLWFPDGRLPSRAWRPVLWIGVAGALAQVLASLNNPFPTWLGIRSGDYLLPSTMPPSLWAVGRFFDRWTNGLANWAGLIAVAAASASLIVRLRRSEGEQRDQLKWLAFAGAFAAIGVAVSKIPNLPAVSGHPHPVLDTVASYGDLTWTLAAAIGIPVLAGVAILKHRLYDIDVVISKTVVYGSLAVFITAVYVFVVVGLGALVGSSTGFNPGLSILATAVVAVAFQPVKERVERVANRLVYGPRATPYEVLSRFADGVAGAFETEEVLPLMAAIAGEGTGAARVDVWVRLGKELRPGATWPTADLAPAAIEVQGDDVPVVPGADHVYPVRHQGELLGALSVRKAPGDRTSPSEERLLAHLASQAGPVLANVRLVGELRASRLRLVAAQDEARRRVERDLHDGAQQRLLTLSMVLRLLRKRAESRDPTLTATIDEADRELKQALEELRELARGIHPAILTRSGLGPALASLAERSAVPVDVAAGLPARFPAPVEATVYFVVSEALANVAKYARAAHVWVVVTNPDGVVQVEVADDGEGGADPSAGSGLTGLSDRVEALGGTFRVDSPAGGGTRIMARIPCG